MCRRWRWCGATAPAKTVPPVCIMTVRPGAPSRMRCSSAPAAVPTAVSAVATVWRPASSGPSPWMLQRDCRWWMPRAVRLAAPVSRPARGVSLNCARNSPGTARFMCRASAMTSVIISLRERKLAWIDSMKCRLCRKCAEACPTHSIVERNFPARRPAPEAKPADAAVAGSSNQS